jgi:NhaP-type Na+/H+ or K+/H+ antiporter
MDPIGLKIYGLTHSTAWEIWLLPLITAVLTLLVARFAPVFLWLAIPLVLLVAWSRVPLVLSADGNAQIHEALGPKILHGYGSAAVVLLAPLAGAAWRRISQQPRREAARG